MSKEQESFYKLHLAYNLITFLIDLQTHGFTPERKAERTDLALNHWEEKITSQLQILNKVEVKKIAKTEGVGEDVIKILMDINQLGSDIVRKEFKDEIRNSIFKGLVMET